MSNTIQQLEARAEAIRAQIDTITKAFGAEYVPADVKNELTMVEASIENARDREAAVAKSEENGRAILGGAFLIEDDGDGKTFRHENSGALCTARYDKGIIRWTYSSENDGQTLALFVTVKTNRLDDCRMITRKIFRIDWKAKSFRVDSDKLIDVERFIYAALTDGIKEFRMAEFRCTVDAIKKSIAAVGIQPE